MKRLILIVTLMVSTCSGNVIVRSQLPSTIVYEPNSITDIVERFKKSNSVLVSPEMNIISAYNWLKSSNRNGDMGPLLPTNRRTLFYFGDINISTVYGSKGWVWDTNGVDIIHFGSLDPKTGKIVRGGGGATVTQTAKDVHFYGGMIKNTGSSKGDTRSHWRA